MNQGELQHEDAIELAVVLPTFNEASNIDRVIATLDRVLQGIVWEAVFVDDNSPDHTAQMLRDRSREDRRIRVIERLGRRGLSSACIEGMMATGAPLVAVMDADLQHDANLLPQMVEKLHAEPELDLVVGSRFVEGGGTGDWDEARLRKSQFATRLGTKLLNLTLSDPMSGFFMIRSERFRRVAPKLSGIGFKILLDIVTVAREPMKIAELPYTFNVREEGESKLDRVVAFEYLLALYDRLFGRILPVRFALFATIGVLGIAVHFAILTSLFEGLGSGFIVAQSAATIGAMTFNFFLNNALTYRDKRLAGFLPMLRGWISFCLFCSVGAIANVGIAAFLYDESMAGLTLSALAGILVGAVWNFALSSRFVWGRY
ncbi:glycosyltransferase family 2 protein [Novosphingopyxis sp. YJ-S2-01]|uniref:glycosyltransferase family 2 protein n=1 Tax=Novosphingopyxis sp. YJ-S2-01 TaxID=2794021 RepID=UPI0018DC0751|nr:glycosyltransferase family 2 protein [Novosphingopyxis sp. YJ-S2-01]MBH9538286.1 glycosyltransferase family 2 protein [Novosphingopyxis sp. YJ-S2-01]